MSSFNRFPRRGVRVVYGLGLENQRNVSYRGFESHPLRNNNQILDKRVLYLINPMITIYI